MAQVTASQERGGGPRMRLLRHVGSKRKDNLVQASFYHAEQGRECVTKAVLNAKEFK